MALLQQICVSDLTHVGETRRKVADLCKHISSDETFIGRASIVATELANNMVLHAKGGEIIATSLHSQAEQAGLELLALDHGPGIENLNESLRDGFSTRGTAGTGLGSIRRLSKGFEIVSHPNHGTAVRCELWPEARQSTHQQFPVVSEFVFGAVNLPYDNKDVCGDAWATLPVHRGRFRAIVADGLGHGAAAATAAVEAVRVFRSCRDRQLADAMCEIHEARHA